MPKAYERSAEFYDLIYGSKDYRREADGLRAFLDREHRSAATFLDVGCGTGAFLVLLKDRYECTGVDVSPPMLQVAKSKLDAMCLEVGDMRTLNLGRKFDIVGCLFSGIGYVRSTQELNDAVQRMADHLHPGGLLVVEPWFTPDQWEPGQKVHGGLLVDCDELKIVRMVVSDVRDRFAVTPMHHLVATLDGVEHFVEEHELLLATEDEYRAAFEQAGLQQIRRVPELLTRGIWVGRAPKTS